MAAAPYLTLADFDGGKSFESVLKNFYRDTLAKLPRSQRAKTEALCEEGLLGGAGQRLMLEERQIHDSYASRAGVAADADEGAARAP